eukprot:385302_1
MEKPQRKSAVNALEVSSFLFSTRPQEHVASTIPLPEQVIAGDSQALLFQRTLSESGLPVPLPAEPNHETLACLPGMFGSLSIPKIDFKDNLVPGSIYNVPSSPIVDTIFNRLNGDIQVDAIPARSRKKTASKKRSKKINDLPVTSNPVSADRVDPPKARQKKKRKKTKILVDPIERHFIDFCNFLAKFNSMYGKSTSLEDIPFYGGSKDFTWSRMSDQIATLSERGLLHKVNVDDFSALLSTVTHQIRDGVGLELLTPLKLPDQSILDRTQKSLEAALIALRITTAPNISRSLIFDDTVEPLVSLVTFLINRCIIALHDSNFRSVSSKFEGKKPLKKRSKGSKVQEEDEIKKDEYWKAISSKVDQIGRKIISIVDQLQVYLRLETMQEPQIYSLINACFNSFLVEKVQDLQISSLSLITAIFMHYESQRSEIIDKLIAVMTKASRKRTYALDGNSRRNIHILSAMSLHLLQSVSAGSLEVRNREELNALRQDVSREERVQMFDSIIIRPAAAASRLAKHLAHAFLRAVVKSAATQRDLLHDSVTDWAQLLFQPEWPAAEMLLHQLVEFLNGFLAKKSEKGQSTARLACLDAIGIISVEVKKHLKAAADRPVEVSEKVDEVNHEAEPGAMGENAKCICNEGFAEERFMLDCDECHRWFHGSCVGVVDSPDLKQWLCEDCLIRNAVNKQKSHVSTQVINVEGRRDDAMKIDGDEDNNMVDEEHIEPVEVLKQLLVNYLTERSREEKNSDTILYARQFHLIDWLSRPKDENDSNNNKQSEMTDNSQNADKVSNMCAGPTDSYLTFFRSQWQPPVLGRDEHMTTISREAIIRIHRQLALSRPLLQSIDSLVVILRRALGAHLATERAKAMRALSGLVSADPSLLGVPEVHDAVTGRCKDTSTSVREVAVDLVGKYIVYCSEFSQTYFDMLKSRIWDSGLSVRKRVIKILRDICVHSPNNENYVEICCLLLPRINDSEESIQVLVSNTIQSLWFSESNEIILGRILNEEECEPAEFNCGEGSALSGDLAKRFSEPFQNLVIQIVDVVKQAPQNQVNLISILSGLLDSEEQKGSTFAHRKIHRLCEDICMCVVDKMAKLDVEGDDVDEFQIYAAICPYVQTLEAFCTARPAFVARHCYELQPYLSSPKLRNKEEQLIDQAISKALCSILLMCLPVMNEPRSKFVEHCQENMKSIIASKGISVLQVAIPCLCYLCEKISEDQKLLTHHLQLYYRFLSSHVEDFAQPPVIMNVVRSLLAMGLFVKYFDFEKHSKDMVLDASRPEVRLTDAIFSLYKYFCSVPSVAVKRHALQGMMFMFSRRPELMYEAGDIIETAFKTQGLNFTMLSSLGDYLDSEDKRLQFLRFKKNSGEKVSADSDDERVTESGAHSMSMSMRNDDSANGEMMSGIIQKYVTNILMQLFVPAIRVRLEALSLLKKIFSHCLINPVLAIPSLIAMLSDEQQLIRDNAFAEIALVDGKYPLVIKSRVGEGLLKSYIYLQRTVNPPVNFMDPASVQKHIGAFGRLYTLVKDRVGSRNAFIKNLLKLLDFQPYLKRLENFEQAIKQFFFVVQIIASIHFEADEPLQIVRRIYKVIPTQGGTLDTALHTSLRVLSKSQSKITEKMVATYQKHCQRSLALSTLVLLCDFMMESYQLTDQQCDQWKRNSRVKCTRVRDCTPLSLASIPMGPLPKFSQDIPQILKQQHKFFKDRLNSILSTIESSNSQDMNDDSDSADGSDTPTMVDLKENMTKDLNLNPEPASEDNSSKLKTKAVKKPKKKPVARKRGTRTESKIPAKSKRRRKDKKAAQNKPKMNDEDDYVPSD